MQAPIKKTDTDLGGTTAITPKRKLSPEATTPTGRQRKISTSMLGSPQLRGLLETVADLDDCASDSNQNLNNQGQAPDLIRGIGLLQLKTGANKQDTPTGVARTSRQRSQTISEALTPTMAIRRRWRTRSARVNSSERSPSQLKITDLFKKKNDNDARFDPEA